MWKYHEWPATTDPGKKATSETLYKKSIIMKKMWEDEEYRKKEQMVF